MYLIFPSSWARNRRRRESLWLRCALSRAQPLGYKFGVGVNSIHDCLWVVRGTHMSVKSDSGAGRKIEPTPIRLPSKQVCGEQTLADPCGETSATLDPGYQRDFGWKSRLNEVIGQVIDDKYQLLELIGTGGMGAVFKAHSRVAKGAVALKILHPHLANEGPSLRRFQLEAKAASRIDHPNSVSVHDFGVWDKQAYLVMDYLEGRSLAYLIRQYGRLKPEFALPVFVQACAGLGAAHKLGIFHRDVKPSNFVVLTRPDGLTTKVCDFGLVKLKVQEGDTITGTGEVFGSPPYMSPEQCLGKKVDERSDMYSMGILMFETLTGFLPIKGANPLDTMRMQVSTLPPPLQLTEEEPLICDRLAEIVNKTLAKEPDQRYQNMEDLRQALLSVEEEMQFAPRRNDFVNRQPASRFNFFERKQIDNRKKETD
jgi:serine/threonine protein kinase